VINIHVEPELKAKHSDVVVLQAKLPAPPEAFYRMAGFSTER
jgi:hypothetical protein